MATFARNNFKKFCIGIQRGVCLSSNLHCPRLKKQIDHCLLVEEGYKKLQESAQCKSLLKKYLTKDVMNRLQLKTTSLGATLYDVIRSGVENPKSCIGVFAADPECYKTFSALFDPIIQEHHGFGPRDKLPPVDMGKDRIAELTPLDPEGKFIKSTRIRCARTLQGFPFNPLLTQENYVLVQNKVKAALEEVVDKEIAGKYYSLEGMNKEVQTQLIYDHFLFKECHRFLRDADACNFWPSGRGIFYNSNKTFLAWVNEEDHLRLISMQNNGNVGQVLQRLIKGIEAVERKILFVRDDHLGWLTFGPANIGTSIRASVHIKLPKISARHDFQDICDELKLQIRDIYGRNANSSEGVCDISNKTRLGITEFAAVKQMHNGVRQLIAMEKKCLEK